MSACVIDHSVLKEIHSKLPSCQRCSLPKTRQQHQGPSEPTLTEHLKKPGAPKIVQNAAKFKHATDAYTMDGKRKTLALNQAFDQISTIINAQFDIF
jgi:hypothetical protein